MKKMTRISHIVSILHHNFCRFIQQNLSLRLIKNQPGEILPEDTRVIDERVEQPLNNNQRKAAYVIMQSVLHKQDNYKIVLLQ